jgi:hypothetical protein
MLTVLLLISFVCYLAGFVSWKWPDQVQQRLENVDGLYHFMAPAAHRALIAASGVVLIVLSFVVLILAASARL